MFLKYPLVLSSIVVPVKGLEEPTCTEDQIKVFDNNLELLHRTGDACLDTDNFSCQSQGCEEWLNAVKHASVCPPCLVDENDEETSEDMCIDNVVLILLEAADKGSHCEEWEFGPFHAAWIIEKQNHRHR